MLSKYIFSHFIAYELQFETPGGRDSASTMKDLERARKQLKNLLKQPLEQPKMVTTQRKIVQTNMKTASRGRGLVVVAK